MIEVQAERDHGDDIEGRHPGYLKAPDDIGVDVALEKAPRGVDRAGRKVENVDDDEDEEQDAAPTHRASGEGGNLRLTPCVADGTGRAVPERELNGGQHVKHDGREKHYPNDPEHLVEWAVEEHTISVDSLRTLEDLQIADHVADDEQHTDEAGHRHHRLLADRRIPEGPQPVHDASPVTRRRPRPESSAPPPPTCATPHVPHRSR